MAEEVNMEDRGPRGLRRADFGGLQTEESGCTPGGTFSASVETFLSASLFSSAPASIRCNAVRSDFFRGIKSRAGGCSPLTVSTLCRGSAAESGERARSCRCPRAGRKPGITMAECFSSITTPGKLHGLTPEIGTLKAREQWDYTHSHKVILIQRDFFIN